MTAKTEFHVCASDWKSSLTAHLEVKEIQKVSNGVFEVNSVDFPGALDLVEEMTNSGNHHYVCFAESNILYHARRNEDVVKALKEADAVFADGVAIEKLVKIHGHCLPTRVSGPGFFLTACEEGTARGWKHFFFGGAEGVAEKLKAEMESRYPDIDVVGTCCPPFREQSDAEIKETFERIKNSGANLVWVALGGPKQELWMNRFKGQLDVPVMLGVGAAFDFHSGNRAWAPKFVRWMGMEWLFRMFTGGRKTFFRNIRCVADAAFFLTTQFIRVKVFRMQKKQTGKESV